MNMIKIFNHRQAVIALATGFTLQVGQNEDVPIEHVRGNEKYLEGLYNAKEISISGEVPPLGEPPKAYIPGDPILDDEGNEVFDEDGIRLVYDEDGKAVSESA
jgi:hypothetical protein